MTRRSRALILAVVIAAAGCSGGDSPVLEGVDRPTTASTAAPTATDTTGTAPVDELHGFRPAPLEFDGCGGPYECATLAVPLDYDDPTGPAIELSIVRDRVDDGDRRIGALLTNPGGPGASGIEFARGDVFDSDITDRFDVISWDPRGVGESSGLECGDEVDDFVRLDSSPDDAAEQSSLDTAASAVASECGEEDGALLPHMGTDDVARDMEAIRLALGGEQISYVGFSYGTLIGLRYAELFPTGARAIVLDGVVDPSDTLIDLLRGQTVGFERAIADVFAGCPAGAEGCPAGGAEAAYDRVAASVEDRPMRAGDDEIGPSEVATGALFVTYSPSLHSTFYDALVAADDGDGRLMLALAEAYRSFGGFTSYQAVSCLDSDHPVGGEAWAAFAAELAAVSPRFGASIANEMLPCAFWPVSPVPINAPVRAEGAPPILVIGTTGDAATPLEQAEAVAAGLARGHLLVYDGPGHTAYGESACIDGAVAAYVSDLAVPAAGTVC